MSRVTRFDHFGITVTDLNKVADLAVGMCLQIEGRTFGQGALASSAQFENEPSEAA